MKRQRGRNRRNNSQPNSNRSLDSNGPDVKVRGTASQIYDKYVAMARDAASSGSRVKAENYRQHAEHYLRVVNAIEAAKQANNRDDSDQSKKESHRSDQSKSDKNSANKNASDSKNSDRNSANARDSKDDKSTSPSNSPRRNTSRNKRNDETPASQKEDAPAGLEVVTPGRSEDKPTDTNPQDGEADAKPKSRRRKAPSRKNTDSETVEAAE